MKEIHQEKTINWKKEDHPSSGLYSASIDPEILRKMPGTSKTFISASVIDLFIDDIKKALHPYDDIPL